MDIQQEIEVLKNRNQRVEADKGWETSWVRRFCIAFLTYFIAIVWLIAIGEGAAWFKAVIPVAGFLLSTFTLPPLKSWWLKRHAKT
jgi:hypothetical protein